LSTHITSVHEIEKPYKCSKCDFSFLQKEKLSTHITSVHGINKLCDKTFTQDSHLENLKAVIHDEKSTNVFIVVKDLDFEMKLQILQGRIQTIRS
jgi:hypothetical protein